MIKKTSLIVLTLLCVIASAVPKPGIDVIEKLIRDSLHPNLSNYEFKIMEENVEGLWDSLGIVIVNAVYTSNGSFFRSEELFYHNGDVKMLVDYCYSLKLLSGIMRNKIFYYTFQSGSGVLRSQVGRLFLLDKKVVIQESDYFFDLFLIVSSSSDGNIRVGGGTANGPWRIITNEMSRLIIVDSFGEVVYEGKATQISIPENANSAKPGFKNFNTMTYNSSTKSNYPFNLKGQKGDKQMASALLLDLNNLHSYSYIYHRNQAFRDK